MHTKQNPLKQTTQKALRRFGYEIRRCHPSPARARPLELQPVADAPPIILPVWPLPRASRGISDDDIRRAFGKFEFWHYAFEFEGGVSFSPRHALPTALADAPHRPLQRFRHFMPYLVAAQGGTLQGKRVLDIACNSGFWSIQCALLGAEVIGFDARHELIEQANLVKRIVGVENVEFKVMDFWDMSPTSLGGTFDVVLNLGILYHLSNPLEALQLTKAMARQHILLDTTVSRSPFAILALRWEEPDDIRNAAQAGVAAEPSRAGLALMLKHVRVANSFEIPVRTLEMPPDYLEQRRASWLITV